MTGNYFREMPEDFNSYEESAGINPAGKYDPCWDFEIKEISEGSLTSIHTKRLLRRCPK